MTRDIDRRMHGIARELAESLTAIAAEPDLVQNRLSAVISHIRAALEDETAAAYSDGYTRGYAACSTDAHVTERVVRAFANSSLGPESTRRSE
ncbi:hypothetical protein DVS28_b0520 (plasmid) [Euzebya pacifica]|uniref:Uncharacterized protein n=1 Tax=Euzebya pacifica TaxID=1608957 RepID=A0A346Y713_9ACTN|nr:hypothetical protein [Euzebya pacifica]AXV10260.1 hypothetical protein DVS28_b0520 [Euzebya pacifica]